MTSTQNATVEALPVTNLRASRKQQAAAKKAPAKAAPAKAAPAAAPAKPAVIKSKTDKPEVVQYVATARSGKVNSRLSATPLVAALDVKVVGRKSPHFAAGVIVGMYATTEKAQAAADKINGGGVEDWSEAIVVDVHPA
jgi:hypothetical protein